jgi:hypothetical protein
VISSDAKDCIGIAVIALAVMFITFIAVHGCITEAIHREAVSAGVAEHYIDADQNKAFRWKTNHVLEVK